MNTKLFVGNLSFNTTENDLQDAFAAHGTVTEANLMMDRATGRPRGFGFVTMSSPEEAQKAIDALNGTSLGDRKHHGERSAPEGRAHWRRFPRRPRSRRASGVWPALLAEPFSEEARGRRPRAFFMGQRQSSRRSFAHLKPDEAANRDFVAQLLRDGGHMLLH